MATIVQDKPGPLLEWRKAKAESLKGLERRVYATGEMELREADDGVLHLTGYASVTETPYDVGFYVETIKRSAFTRTLNEAPDVTLLLNHEGLPLARTKAGTLRLTEDERGLHVDADLDPVDPDTIVLKRKMDRGDLDGQMSMAFQVTSQRWDDEYTHREILGLSLNRGDVSIVTQGASPTTSASIRSNSVALALADLGSDVVVAAFREWRDWTLVPVEKREGKKLSAATTEVLTQVSGLLDEADALLTELLGVSDPESDTEAGDSVERSIDSEKGLCAAIRAALREPDKDERRAEIIERAAELDLSVMVPTDWSEDGKLAEGRAFSRVHGIEQEQRETFNDTYTALQGALDEKLEDSPFYYFWVQDFTDTDVIYYAGGKLWSAPYTLVPSGPVTVGDGEEVRPVTEYVPTESAAEEAAEPAVERSLPDFTTRAAQEFELLMLREGRR